MHKRADIAAALFDDGFVCSQAVLAAFGDLCGLDKELALKISNGFGGGIARKQEVCGAVSGAVMAIGLKYGRTEAKDKAAHEKTYEKINTFCKRFTDKNGSVICRELLGCGMAEANEKRFFSTLCRQFVQDSAEILEDILEET